MLPSIGHYRNRLGTPSNGVYHTHFRGTEAKDKTMEGVLLPKA